jgi:NAD(P)-dependent dehydrogenase (short-subunit alcohol dehydrogenase family)/acyl carrier protein
MGFHGLIALAQALGNVEPAAGVGLTVLTTGMQEVGSEGLPYPEKATVLGAVRVIPQEYAGIACRSVDVDRPASGQWSDDEVDRLLGECLDDAGEPVVARRRGERWVQAVEPFPLARGAAAPRLRERGAYLITGGLGGIGLELARLLAGSVRARLVLLGRTPLPPRAEWDGVLASSGEDDPARRRIAAVRALEERGAEVLVLAADVSDPRQMEDALVRAESRFGRIHGVIHAAGVAGGGVVQLKTRAEAERVMAPKVRGTLVLDALLKDRRPEFVAICSSLASVQGGPGQADYAAANAFQDAYARRAAGAGGPFVVSIGWDAWREAGMAVETRAPKDLVARREAWLAAGEGIRSDEGADAFERALRQPLPHVLVSTIDLLARLSRYRAPAAAEAAPAREAAPAAAAAWSKGRHRRPDLAGAYVAPRDEVEQVVADVWQELLGFEQVGVHDGFFDLGGHSLLATQVINRLRQAFQVSLRLQTLFDGPTVAELAAALVAGEEQPGQVRAIAQLLRAVESLPEDEVDRLLDAQGTAAGSAP